MLSNSIKKIRSDRIHVIFFRKDFFLSFDYILLHLFLAPSGPPVGFVGSARSSSEIITQWQPPLEEHRNGQILGYVIRFRLYGYNESPWTNRNITNEVRYKH